MWISPFHIYPHDSSVSYQARFSDEVQKAEDNDLVMRPRSPVALTRRQIHRPSPLLRFPSASPEARHSSQPAYKDAANIRLAGWPEIGLTLRDRRCLLSGVRSRWQLLSSSGGKELFPLSGAPGGSPAPRSSVGWSVASRHRAEARRELSG